MKKVFIKYNPYTLKTEIKVNGCPLAENSVIAEKSAEGNRMQEWIEEFPELLVKEFNDDSFEITFHGTELDYEDLFYVFNLAYNNGDVKYIKADRIPAKETADKEKLIEDIFREIQKGPFDELRSKELNSAFENARSKDFEVCIVATMSSGKSTLINAMLGDKLMPSQQEACTATITRIKDTDSDKWTAEVFDKNDKRVKSYDVLTLSDMEQLNKDEKILKISVKGDIPFVEADDVSLVLIDTPGPNNALDKNHGQIQSEFLSGNSKSLIIYIMEPTSYQSNDNKVLFERVAESMQVGGKQSKDRFIFVVNKMDGKSEEGDISGFMRRVEESLVNSGIERPNLFPVSAYHALNLRLIAGNKEIVPMEKKNTIKNLDIFNGDPELDYEGMHLEDYASLPKSIMDDISKKAKDYKDSGDEKNEALIHTGVPSVEAAVRQYVQKYAKTAKIKNIADTFTHNLEEIKCFEKIKAEIGSNKKKAEQINLQLNEIQKSIDDVSNVRNFEKAVNEAVKKVEDEARETVRNITLKYQNKINQQIESNENKKYKIDEVEREVARLSSFAKNLEPQFQTELNDIIRNNLINTSNALLNEYRNKLAAITEQIEKSIISDIAIDPLKLMSGSIANVDNFSYNNLKYTEQVKDGTEWVKNTNRKWYKPWTLFQEKGYYRDKFKDVQFVKGDALTQKFFMNIEKGIHSNADATREYASEQSKKIARFFKAEFNRLDAVLKGKIAELKKCAADQANADKRLKESQQKLAWLEKIQGKIESILEI